MHIRLKCSVKYVIIFCISGVLLLLMLNHGEDGANVVAGQSYKLSQSLPLKRKFKETLAMKEMELWIDDFQRVTDDDSILVYSAYADGETKVRVIGITNDTKADINCLLWYHSSQVETKLVKAYIANINENHGKKHTAAYILCYLCGEHVPDAISIVKKSTIHNPRNILPVKVNPHLQTRKNFTMCLSPIHSLFNDSLQLLEWIELNRILGVQKFFLYVKSVSDDVNRVLKYYNDVESNADVKVLPWSLPDILCDDVMLHYCGQLAALNDCLYRNKGHSFYTVSSDLDEFIIPYVQNDYTWADMLLRIPDYSVHLFRNSFVMRDYDTLNSIKGSNSLMTDYIMRDDFIYGPRDRSKMIARTDDVVTFGIHNVWAMQSGEEHGVDPNIGILHHYRKIPVVYPEGVNVTRIKNTATMKYSKELRKRISSVIENMRNASKG